MQSGSIKITREQVDDVLDKAEIRDEKWWGNTTVVSVRLENGWTMTETSACVDPSEYDHELGKQICLGKMKDRIWLMLGWSLNCQHNGELI